MSFLIYIMFMLDLRFSLKVLSIPVFGLKLNWLVICRSLIGVPSAKERCEVRPYVPSFSEF